MDPNFTTPYGEQFNLQVQHQFAGGWLVDAAYVGSLGRHLLNRRQINPSIIRAGASTANTEPRRIYNVNNPQSADYGGAVFSGITNQLTDSNSSYNSLQLALTRRFAHGLSTTQAYTWSHAIDDASGLRTTSNPYGRGYDRGNSTSDLRHRFVGSIIYELPFFKDRTGFMRQVFGGITMSTVYTFQSGLPFDITEPTDRALSGAGDNRPDVISTATLQTFDPRANTLGRANSFFDGTGGGSASAATNPYFRRVGTGTSLAAGAGRYGNLGRNVFHGPGLSNVDVSVSKGFRISERARFELRGESFNVANHTNFNNPSGNIGSSTFGRITSAADPRFIQLSLRLSF